MGVVACKRGGVGNDGEHRGVRLLESGNGGHPAVHATHSTHDCQIGGKCVLV